MTPEQELRTNLAMTIIDATETDGNTDLTIDQITKLVDDRLELFKYTKKDKWELELK